MLSDLFLEMEISEWQVAQEIVSPVVEKICA